jgi:prepilin-type N-terminal cleavage/methylation domain-containing protein
MIMEKNNSQNGFTLIEVLIAIALLTIGILGAATMQIASIGGNSLAIRLTSAATWASDTQETLMALPYTAPGASTPTDPMLADDNNNGYAGLDDTDTAGSPADGGPVVQGDYIIFWNVADNYPINNCKTIRVLVRRNDKGIMKTVTQTFTKMRAI